MTEYGTIKIPEPAYDYHNERRQEMGVTWEQYINGNAPDRPEAADTQAVVDDLVTQLPPRIAEEMEGRLR